MPPSKSNPRDGLSYGIRKTRARSPRLGPDCKRFSIESIDYGVEGEKVKDRNMRSVLAEIEAHADAVVDVGSSNVEVCYEELRKIPGSQDVFDLFVIPTTPQRKQHFDTLAKPDRLQAPGRPADKDPGGSQCG